MRVVAAVGGNALLRRGQPLDAALQRANVQVAADALATTAAAHQLVVTHGNGPQVGLLALQSEAYRDVRPYPLDVLGAETEGMIGYLLNQELANRLPGREVATLLTQTVVDSRDPAFERPAKPVGPVYSEAEAARLAVERGWRVAPDGPGWRRVVPSPEPRRIVELGVIRLLVDAGVLVVCAGGGGIPVVEEPTGTRRGVEAVVDKDLAAAVLAIGLDADLLVLLTDVDAVCTDWGSASTRRLRQVPADRLDRWTFPAGSMAPKVAAAQRFVRATGRAAAIGALCDTAALVRGEAGTRVTPGRGEPEWWTQELTKGAC